MLVAGYRLDPSIVLDLSNPAAGERTLSLSNLTSREAVVEAIREYDQIGREAFLQKYGFDAARRYYVEHDGKRYESKAIAGVAVGKQYPDRGALRNTEFTGGVGSVGKKMVELGFRFVDTLKDSNAPSFGDLLADAMARFEVEKSNPFGRKEDLWAAMESVKSRLLSYDAVLKRPHIICDWSLGAGNWLKTPWIALFDDRITTSAQRGTYLVLLVSEDLEHGYLTLNQGATEHENALGYAGAKRTLRDQVLKFRAKLDGLNLEALSFEDDVDLKTKNSRSRLYELGTIAYVRTDPFRHVTDAEMERDLEQLLTAYEAITDQGSAPRSAHSEVGTISHAQRPTNLILYGPPGTGKTFGTASRAVEICDGVLPEGDQRAVMDRYKALKSAGRIEFVTFHQSFGYEDFVEGLRPQTEPDDGEGEAASGGFRLKAEPGIFKRIAALAEQSGTAHEAEENYDLSGRQFYKMSLGRSSDQSEVYEAAIKGGYVALGWGGDIDWSDPAYDSYQAILEKWREIEPEISGNRGDVVQTYHLRVTMRPGDIVIVSDGNKKFRAIGEITGDYEFVADAAEFKHRRGVKWLRTFDKSLPVDLIFDGNFTMMSLYRLDAKKLKTQALQSLIGATAESHDAPGEPEPYVLIIDEINRANVSKVFGELITLLEPDKRLGCENELTVTLPYSKEEFGVPANLHVIGTMNTADRSIALLDTALRRRFKFEELMPNPDCLANANVATGVDLVGLLATLNERIEYLFDREHQVGHAYFMPCETKADVDEVMRHKVIPLLAEYFYESWEKVWQVLGEPEDGDEGAFLSRRKLSPPKGSDTFGQDRWRYHVKAAFAPDVYDQLA